MMSGGSCHLMVTSVSMSLVTTGCLQWLISACHWWGNIIISVGSPDTWHTGYTPEQKSIVRKLCYNLIATALYWYDISQFPALNYVIIIWICSPWNYIWLRRQRLHFIRTTTLQITAPPFKLEHRVAQKYPSYLAKYPIYNNIERLM